jgi:hypothetical protein
MQIYEENPYLVSLPNRIVFIYTCNRFPSFVFYIAGRETYIAGRETYIAGRETYIAGRAIYISGRAIYIPRPET